MAEPAGPPPPPTPRRGMGGLRLLPAVGARRPRPGHIRVFPSDEVTTIGEHEVDPGEVGLDSGAVDAIWRSVVAFYKIGLHPALSLCIRRRGEIILQRTIGHASGNGPDDGASVPKLLATPDTPFNFFSGSKAITSMLLHLQVERGLLELHAPVARYIPEFARNGKGRITIRQVLAHRAGLEEMPPGNIDLDLLIDPEAILSRICDAKPRSRPGKQQAYHAVTSGFIAAGLVRRVTGIGVQEHLQREIRGPLGFRDLRYGVTHARLPDVARDVFTGPAPMQPFSGRMRASLGIDVPDVVGVSTDPRYLTGVVPPGNIIASAGEICRFFELLRQGGTLDGVRVFKPETVARAIRPQYKPRLDRIILLPVNYGLGFMLGGELISFYGPGTPAAFGHLGFTNVLGWADPEREISVAFLNNGKPFITPELLPWLNIMRVIGARIPRQKRRPALPGA